MLTQTTPPSFPQELTKDTLLVGDLLLSTLFIVKDKDLPWFMLVPKKENIRELVELSEHEQQLLLKEINVVSHLILDNLQVHKINIGMIGNVVPTFHVHIVGRFKNDREFPSTIWGKRLDPQSEIENERIRELLLMAKKLKLAH